MSVTARHATDPRNFAWISANAGSGKTRLLTDRVTRLLLQGADVSRILCLTYTKAAAAEMASRLFDRLGAWALLADDRLLAQLEEIGAGDQECSDLKLARRLFAQALETPGGLKIQTIHAFCQSLLARFPVEAGIPAKFSVIDERDAAQSLEEARNFVLEKAAAGDGVLGNAIGLLAGRASDARFADILHSAIVDRGKLEDLLSRHGGDPQTFVRHLRKVLDVAETDSEDAVLSRLCAELADEKRHFLSAAELCSSGSKTDAQLSGRLTAFVTGGMGADHYDSLKSAFFTAEGTLRKNLVTKKTAEANPKSMAWLDSVKRRVLAVEDQQRRIATANMTEAVLRVAFAMFDRYREIKRARSALDYDDLITFTLRLLASADAAQWVLYKLDGGIDHILVDEGQDTSREQWQIVSRLAAEFFAGLGARPEARHRRLFVVGDEKQSIFSFQGAEPAAFGEYRDSFRAQADGAGLPFIDYRPAISRRSATTILNFVDAVFDPEAARNGLTSGHEPIHHDADRKELGRVEIWPLVPSPERREFTPLAPVDAPEPGAHSVLAARIADRIAGWLKQGICLAGGEPIAAADIMILVRRRNAFSDEMIRELLDRGVPVAGADRMVLLEQLAIQDLVALGHFVLLPEDDLNLAALLKSPILGFNEQDLYDLAQPRKETLWEELCARANERAAFAEAQKFLAGVLSEADQMPPFEFYSRILNRGARARLVARLGLETDDAIDEFLALALAHERAHVPSLQSFLAWFAEGAGEVKRDMEQAGGAVRIMTVHGAKGLEAKAVFLPDTFQTPNHEARGNLLFTDDCVFFGMPGRAECQAITTAKADAHEREMREYRRLLYVAATRARDALIVCGYNAANRKEPSPYCWYSLLDAAGRKLGKEETIDGETIIVIGAPFSASMRASASVREIRTPKFLREIATPEPITALLRPSRIPGLEEPVCPSPVGQTPQRFRRGLLMHSLLAKLPDIPRDQRDSTGLAWLARQGIAGGEAKSLLLDVLSVLDAPQFSALFGDNSRAEVAITARFPELGNAQISGQIDRVAVTENAVLIADFKTNREVPANPAEVPKLYLAQMALYRAALRKIYSGKDVGCVLVWTDSALLMALPDELLDREMDRLAAISATEAQLDPN
ncbi:MAG TPA: double-strand break repair helicase AddA [Micropepsaceae bacterium]|nr:double-strand break repair helicase AddA [Micropepsaceae bacterium]